jgi:hypothetical protein
LRSTALTVLISTDARMHQAVDRPAQRFSP